MDIDGILDDSVAVSGGDLIITPAIRDFLQQSAGWGKFMAIVGFVFMGLGIISVLFLGGAVLAQGFPGMEGMGTFFLVIYVVLFALFLIPLFYLYNFSTKTQQALQSDNQAVLTDAFENHKSLFKFYGVFLAIMLGFYALIFVIAIVAG